MSYLTKQDEFFQNVWDHSNDSFQMGFDARRPIGPTEIAALERITSCLRSGGDDEELAREIHRQLSGDNSGLFQTLLQLIGLTRNKILQDLKAANSVNRTALRLSSHQTLVSHGPTWQVAGSYLAKRVRTVFAHLTSTPQGESFIGAVEALNQATWPGYIRQERAKRSGHEAEYRAAVLMQQCQFAFTPKEKADNPLCRDAQIREISFDLVIPSTEDPKVCIKSTVHTANIGQYGESKDALEMAEARQLFQEHYPEDPPTLVALIDGVGFESNRAGLRGVLENSDEFCQFKTLWKLAAIAAHRLNVSFALYLPADARTHHSQFLAKYAPVVHLNTHRLPPEAVAAGEGYFSRT